MLMWNRRSNLPRAAKRAVRIKDPPLQGHRDGPEQQSVAEMKEKEGAAPYQNATRTLGVPESAFDPHGALVWRSSCSW
jgi:hypothetical protein